MHACMRIMTRVISLSDEAYGKLKAAKNVIRFLLISIQAEKKVRADDKIEELVEEIVPATGFLNEEL